MPPSMSSSSLQLISSKPAPPPASLSSSSSSSLSSVAATHSPFSECRCRLVLHLHPSHLANLMDGIHTHLNTYLLTHQPQLSHTPHPHTTTTITTTTTTSSTTVVLAYSNITLLSTTASIFYDRPYLNFPIALTLTTLALTAGTTHHGRVSKVSADHVTLLVYGVFHCVVGRGEIPAWYEFGLVEGKDGRRQEVMADTRRCAIDGWTPKGKSGLAAAASSAAAGGGEDGQLNKKQAAKLQKQQEKEQRRQAFLRTQQPTTTPTTDDDPLDYAVRVGSLVRFVVLSTAANDSFFAMAGSLTAEGAAVVAGDVVVPAEWKAKEEAEDEERRRKEEEEATSVEKLFAGEEEEETAADALNTPTLDGTTSTHVSKKELKAQKKLDKANRKAAKALRKQIQQQQPAAAQGGAIVTLHDKAEAMRRREKEEEAEELGRRREEDNQVNSVFVEEVFSHVDEHIIGGEGEEEEAGEGAESVKERRKRGRDEAKGVKGGEDREKKKKRKSTKGES